MKTLTLPKINNLLHLGMFLMIIKVSFSLSKILPYSNMVDTVLSLASAGCLAIHILQQKYSIKTLIIYGVLTILALYSSLKVQNFGLLITVMTCLAIRREPIDDIFSFIFRYELFFFIVHTLYAILRHLFLNESIKVLLSGVERYHFGMGHPNRFSIYLFNLIILWIFLNFNRLRNSHIAIIFSINMVAYLFTKTRTNLVEMIGLIIVLLMLSNFRNGARNIVRKVAMFIGPVLCTLTMICVTKYKTGNSLILKIDDIITSRIRLGAYAYEKYGLTMLGKKMSFAIQYDTTWRLNAFTFDNIFTFFCMSQGIIWLIILFVLFFMLAKKSDSRINFAIIAWMLYGITEVHGVNCYMCFPILLVALLFDWKKQVNAEGTQNACS